MIDEDNKICISYWRKDPTLYGLLITAVTLQTRLPIPISIETLISLIEHLALNRPSNQFELSRDVDFEDSILAINH